MGAGREEGKPQSRDNRTAPASRLSLDEYAADLAARWNTILDIFDRIEPQELVSWRDLASCKDSYDPVFFPEVKKTNTTAARRWCKDCAVRVECGQYAITNDVREGVWGGMSYRQRKNTK